ncbi:MAG: hypothetical protein PHI31_16005 [Desulfuromonadaceae bacterium]|nr:hypothetical protein [Desulfuromonadaceae bacterium]
MMLLRTSRHIIAALLIGTILVASTPAQTNTTEITWYTGGETKLTLAPIPLDTVSSVVIAGTTSQKSMIVTVKKDKGPARSNPLPIADDGSFNVLYLFKDGIGTYTVRLSGSRQRGSLNYQGLGFFTHTVKKALPANLINLELNGKIMEYVNRVIGTTVGRGECWDLAQESLDLNLADWTRPTTFGRLLNVETDEIKAGDIIQFRSVKTTEHLPGGITRYESFGAPDHTAIICNILGKKHYTLAHQNVGGNKSVIKGDINLTKITRGKYWIYRPIALMIQL